MPTANWRATDPTDQYHPCTNNQRRVGRTELLVLGETNERLVVWSEDIVDVQTQPDAVEHRNEIDENERNESGNEENVGRAVFADLDPIIVHHVRPFRPLHPWSCPGRRERAASFVSPPLSR